MRNGKIRVAICGYGNLGKAVEKEIKKNPDMDLVAIFSGKPKEKLNTKTKVFRLQSAEHYQEFIDVVIMCGDSETDLGVWVPRFAKYFNTVDSFDASTKIFEYYNKIDKVACRNGHISIISAGCNPGICSFVKLFQSVCLPRAKTYSFWGKEYNSLCKFEGVKDAIQYIKPIRNSKSKVKKDENSETATIKKYLRECYVVVEEGSDKKKIKEEIETMPEYVDEYKTKVCFVSEEEFKDYDSCSKQGGFVKRSGKTAEGSNQTLEFHLNLDSNCGFVASILVCYARAACIMNQNNSDKGAKTVFDVPLSCLSLESRHQLIKMLV